MPVVRVERVPVQAFGLGLLGFDHLQIVFQSETINSLPPQEAWYVIEGLRDVSGGYVVLGVEGSDGGTTLSDANGGLTGEALIQRIGQAASRGPVPVAEGLQATSLWADLTSIASDIEGQKFPYIAAALPTAPMPTVNSSSLVASLLHHAGVAVAEALPSGLRLSPGISTLLGTTGPDSLSCTPVFTTLLGGGGDDRLSCEDARPLFTKLYGGEGNDVLRRSAGFNILHGGQPGLDYADDGHDTADFTGAGELRVNVPPPGPPHLTPDFIVTHAGGEDYLFSIEEIKWDARSDRIIAGPGVGLTPLAGADGNSADPAVGDERRALLTPVPPLALSTDGLPGTPSLDFDTPSAFGQDLEFLPDDEGGLVASALAAANF